ncbi:thioredoxin family protein [Halobacterium litoreum]|uniref:Thioredoxin family protein n=1 Tax=Halobacterium litoreum TaxID=2039234 RepID=A0ABD5NIF5_9EURY|nr:thioredoxin family protein [Halobacterium litoreum]UHH12216.1 thioredoxin family protein [Halobacterium litoreum]
MTDETIDEIKARKKRELQQNEAGGDVPSEPVEIESADHLDDVLANHDTVLVDFHAVWCGPCQMMAPAVNKLAADDDVVVAKVDVDERKQLAQAWGVQGMPTLVVAEDGEEVERAVGARSYDGLRGLVA